MQVGHHAAVGQQNIYVDRAEQQVATSATAEQWSPLMMLQTHALFEARQSAH
jgi:hypothetical protein